MDGNITITKEAYFRLRVAEAELAQLNAGGVDNWEWYCDCFDNWEEVQANIQKEIENTKEKENGNL